MEMRQMPRIGETVSRLGMGLMRLPTNDGKIHYEEAEAMIDRLIEAGVTYYDTAFMYHGGESETFAKKALIGRHKRDSFTIATKMPLGEAEKMGAQAIFDKQQEKLGTDVIDFYLMHGINGGSIDHMNRIGADEVARKMKEAGRIRYIGFSYHGAADDLPKVLDAYDWDFCQLQLNYFDWYGGDGEKLYNDVTSRKIALVVMEPVRGGGLARCHPDILKVFSDADPNLSPASWAMRWCGSLPGIDVVLSGMSDMSQVEDNVRHFSPFVPLTDDGQEVVKRAMDAFKALPLVPCTECNYCAKCPQSIPIPRIFGGRNDIVRFGSSWFMTNYRNWIKPENQISACTACGTCEAACPQGINIIERLKEIEKTL
ncbi:MAG: aldo/keto reductase [Oscillospiraceae bacterium]|jgi:predicted aldo/keto reductase-like oxidoreductase|nr:aldo/keto reductase [Oscillospiraceae bacterium]